MIPRSAAQLCLIRGAGCLGRSIFFAGVFSLEIVGDRIDNQLLQSEGGALRRLSADEGIVQKGQPDYGVRRGHPNGAVERLNKALECADPPGAPVLDPDGSFTPAPTYFFSTSIVRLNSSWRGNGLGECNPSFWIAWTLA